VGKSVALSSSHSSSSVNPPKQIISYSNFRGQIPVSDSLTLKYTRKLNRLLKSHVVPDLSLTFSFERGVEIRNRPKRYIIKTIDLSAMPWDWKHNYFVWKTLFSRKRAFVNSESTSDIENAFVENIIAEMMATHVDIGSSKDSTDPSTEVFRERADKFVDLVKCL
jgi:hypothetical protein